MDKVTLVNFDIETGKDVIDALDRDGKNPRVALWAKLPEYEDWRLVIASDHLMQTGSLYAYSQINAAMEKAGIPTRNAPRYSCVQWTSRLLSRSAAFLRKKQILTGCDWAARCSAINIWKTLLFIASNNSH
jgi:hypothetical protein